MSVVKTINPVRLFTVETAADECICVPTLDVFIDVTVMGEGDDSD